MRTIAIMNVKGGVGKTMTACNMAHILSDIYRRRVLLVDCDPQANATAYFNSSAEECGLTELLTGLATTYAEVAQHTEYENLDIIACDSSLFGIDVDTIRNKTTGKLTALRDLAEAVRNDDSYDVIIMDLPPSFTAASIAALTAADAVIVPVKMDAFSLSGMDFLLDQLSTVHRIAGGVIIDGVLVTLWHNCECNTQGEAQLRDIGIPVFETHIRRSDKADESTWLCQPICEYSKFSSTARDYRAFVAEYVLAHGDEMKGGHGNG